MDKYNYHESICDDIREYIANEVDINSWKSGYTQEDLCNFLEVDLWSEDSVTGNASGSYTFSTWRAEENLCHNMDLLDEACAEFGEDVGDAVKKGAEFCDVTIRCYLLNLCINQVVKEIWEEE